MESTSPKSLTVRAIRSDVAKKVPCNVRKTIVSCTVVRFDEWLIAYRSIGTHLSHTNLLICDVYVIACKSDV